MISGFVLADCVAPTDEQQAQELAGLQKRVKELHLALNEREKQQQVIDLLRKDMESRTGLQLEAEERIRNLDATLARTLSQLENAYQRNSGSFSCRVCSTILTGLWETDSTRQLL